MIGPHDFHTAAQLFDPHRLTIAREFRGLTKNELAAKVEKTPSAISQFESGRVRPDGRTIGRLVVALNMPASFFAQTSDALPMSLIPLDHCHFRSLRSASQRGRRQLLAKASLLAALLSFLEQRVKFPPERVTAAAGEPRSIGEIELLADRVRREWGLGLGPIGSMINLLERHGVLVIPIDEGCREVDAFSMWIGARPALFLVMEKGSTSRTRMDAAHELGHLAMHADVAAGSPELERQANQFASAFLLPRESFYHEAPRRLQWPHIWELKARWKVSAAAIIKRTYDLGLLTEATYRRAFVQLNDWKEDGREPHDPPMEPPVAIGKGLGLIREEFSLRGLAERLGLRTADLHRLVHFTHPAPLTELDTEPAGANDYGPLFESVRRPND